MTKRKTETMNDLSRYLDSLDMDATLIAVIKMSQSSWLVAGIVPGVERQPLKKIAIDEHALLNLLSRWREEAEKKGHKITRVTVAFEAGHDGFWLARWLAAFGIEVHVIHASSPTTLSSGGMSSARRCGHRRSGVAWSPDVCGADPFHGP
jgi:transposase